MNAPPTAAKPEKFNEYSLVLREIEPGVFIVVSFNSIRLSRRDSDPLRARDQLVRRNSAANPA